MKTYLIRSIFLGVIVMVLSIIPIAILTVLQFESSMGFGDVIYMAWFSMSQPSVVCSPLLLVIITWVVWSQIKKTSADIGLSEAKKQLMISVWVSTTIAVSPLLLLSLFLLIDSVTTKPTNGGDATGLGMAMFFSASCLFYNLFLVLIIGLLARLLVKKENTETFSPL